MVAGPACKECGRGQDEVRLTMCPVCRARVCAAHVKRRGGKAFCSGQCAAEFFLADDTETAEQEVEDA
ncbi:MAG: hypothetical protein KBD01_04060 [Acidobacteria bacterium]|nr:hypothetical protein [Acidobacteriota bacterium]